MPHFLSQSHSKILTLSKSIHCLLALLLVLSAPSAFARPVVENLSVNAVLGDGKDGRPWYQWQHAPQGGKIAQVTAVVQRVSGGDGTFVNLRFGAGQAFENGKQVFLRSPAPQNVSWTINQDSNNQPLVMNAYNGAVRLLTVRISYAGGQGLGNQPQFPNLPRPGVYNPRPTNPRPSNPGQFGNNSPLGGASNSALCQSGNYNYPRIEVDEVKSSGGLFSGKYRIRGSIFGACIEEAGYYERGRLVEAIASPQSGKFQRTPFNLRVRSGRNGELRVLSGNGGEDRIAVDDLVQSSQQNSGGGIFP